MTAKQRRILDVLAVGRGRHAPMAYLTISGIVTVYRGCRLQCGRRVALFDPADVWACVDAGWVVRDKQSGRFRITAAGRAKQQEEPHRR